MTFLRQIAQETRELFQSLLLHFIDQTYVWHNIMDERCLKINVAATQQEIMVSKDFGKIGTPSRMLVAGPSMAGKSNFILEVLKYRSFVYTTSFDRIIYCLPADSLHLHQEYIQKIREVFSSIEIVEGLPDLNGLHIREDKRPKLLIIEDMMLSVFESPLILDLVTNDSHHCNCSIIVTCQNIFMPSKYGKTFVRNCSEKVLFYDKTDANQLSIISRQIFPARPNFLKSCFDWIYTQRSEAKLKYLLIDSSALTRLPYSAIVRSFIFPEHSDSKVRPIFFFPEEKPKI